MITTIITSIITITIIIIMIIIDIIIISSSITTITIITITFRTSCVQEGFYYTGVFPAKDSGRFNRVLTNLKLLGGP